MVVHLVSARLAFVMLTVAAKMVDPPQLMVEAALDCSVHLAVHHHTVDIDLGQQIVDFAVGLAEMVILVDLVDHTAAVVLPDIVVLHQALFNSKNNEKIN